MRHTELEAIARRYVGFPVEVQLLSDGEMGENQGTAQQVAHGRYLIRMRKSLQNHPRAASFVFWHEVGHCALNHVRVKGDPNWKTNAPKSTPDYNEQAEIEADNYAKRMLAEYGEINMSSKAASMQWVEEMIEQYAERPTMVVFKDIFDGTLSAVGTRDGYEWQIHLDKSLLGENAHKLKSTLFHELGAVAVGDATGARFYESAAWAAKHLQALDAAGSAGGPVVTTERSVVKALGANRLGGYAVMWGGPDAKDFDGEWFDPQTEELTSIFKAMGRLPYLYHHGMDSTLKTAVVGAVDVLEPDEIGLWYEAQMDIAHKYWAMVKQLVSKAVLGTSSGTLPGAARVEKSGRIARWPLVEVSATPSPVDSRMVSERPIAEVKAAYRAIGLDFLADDRLERARQLEAEIAALESTIT
jgi:hypothetical protein